MEFSACATDDLLRPAARGCRGDLDFTIKFEKIFFSLVPASIFAIASLTRVVYLSRRPTLVGGIPFKYVKVVCSYRPQTSKCEIEGQRPGADQLSLFRRPPLCLPPFNLPCSSSASRNPSG